MLFREALERDLQQTQTVCAMLKKKGMAAEALKYQERAMTLTSELHGNESRASWEARKGVAEMSNKLALEALNDGQMAQSYQLLTRAEQLTAGKTPAPQSDRLRLRALTMKNLGCYYKKKGQLKMALKCLKKAVKLETRLVDPVNPADTHLNICAILSLMGKHMEALEHAEESLILLQDELAITNPSQGNPPKDRVAVMAICYHNIAVEQEYLKKYDLAIQSYNKAKHLADQHLGTSLPCLNPAGNGGFEVDELGNPI